MRTFILTEEQIKSYIEASDVLNEVVYVNGINGKKANLTYDKTRKNGSNEFLKKDKLSTDKMQETNADTYIVPLKGGIDSYNITSIDGTHVMHYFKKYFQHEKEKFKDANNNEYELEMLSNEFNQFMNDFKQKVWRVISYNIANFQQEDKTFNPTGISLYPVPSSSNFNEEMVKRLNKSNIGGLNVQTINQSLFVKDLRNLQKDDEFISYNKKFYSGDMYKTPTEDYNGTYEQNIDELITRKEVINKMFHYAELANEFSKDLITQIGNYNYGQKKGQNTSRMAQQMARNYKLFCDAIRFISQNAVYLDPKSGKEKSMNAPSIYQYIKGYKPASVEKRSAQIWSIVKPYLRGMVSDVDGKPYSCEDVVEFQKVAFEIKKLADGIRMGLKNIYNPNQDENLVKQEVEKTTNTVFVIFDDNISGGSTLSDVCMQAKNVGIQHIVPITFGQMDKGNGGNVIPINQPYDINGVRGQYNYKPVDFSSQKEPPTEKMNKFENKGIVTSQPFGNDSKKKTITILWLDDMRSPDRYLTTKNPSETFGRNAEFYGKMNKEYNMIFTWVHNLNEFKQYIETKGLPDLVSFDFDLGKGIEKGSECAKWLVQYCTENGKSLPKYFIHSANNNAQKIIPTILGNDTRLNQ